MVDKKQPKKSFDYSNCSLGEPQDYEQLSSATGMPVVMAPD